MSKGGREIIDLMRNIKRQKKETGLDRNDAERNEIKYELP
jgi:hypothetical protein